MDKDKVALFSAIDDIFYNQADYTNTYPVLPLDDSLARLQLLRLPEDSESGVENAAQFLTGEIGDIARFTYVQTRGYGHFFLDGEDEEPSTFFQLGDTAQLSGVVWDIQMTSWPSYDSFEASKMAPWNLLRASYCVTRSCITETAMS